MNKDVVPDIFCLQEPSSYVAEYTAPATLITSSCKIAKNTTDGWTKTLYSAGDPVTYASWDAFMVATMNGSQAPVFSASVRLFSPPSAPCPAPGKHLQDVHIATYLCRCSALEGAADLVLT